MHPDALIAGLRRELQRAPERKTEIEAEIAAVDKQPRPEVLPENPDVRVDHQAAYLEGLRQELRRAEPERHKEIKAEIARVEKSRAERQEDDVSTDQPSAAEVEQRKQARTGLPVERAVNEPGGRPAVSSAPAQGAEKEQS